MGRLPSPCLFVWFFPSHLLDYNKITIRLEVNESAGNESSCGEKPKCRGKLGLFSTVSKICFLEGEKKKMWE